MLLGLPVIVSQLVQTYLLQRDSFQTAVVDCQLHIRLMSHSMMGMAFSTSQQTISLSFNSPVFSGPHPQTRLQIFQTLFLKVKHHLIAPDEPRQCMKSSLLMPLSTVDRPFPTSVVAQSVIKNNTRIQKSSRWKFLKRTPETSELSEEEGPKKRHARRSKEL